MALTQVSTGGVKDGTILNADINSSASIAGSKISPIFTSATEVQNSTFKITDSNPEILLAVPSGGLDSRILNDGSGNLIIGHGINSDTPTERLRLDSSGNVRIGINDNEPAQLELRYSTVPTYLTSTFDGTVGEATLSVNVPRTSDGSGSWGSHSNTGYGSSAIQVLSHSSTGGYVSILTGNADNTNPTEKLRVDANGTALFAKSVYGEQDSEDFYRIKFNDVGGIGNDVGIGQPDSSSIGFNTVSNGSIRFYQGTDGEVARIHDNTYFGIGTTTPHRPIHQHVPNSGANYHQFTNTATGKLAADGGLVGIDGNEALILWNQENTPTRFATNNQERGRITSDGHFLIGTTTTALTTSSFGIGLFNNGAGLFYRNAGGSVSTCKIGGNAGEARIDGAGNITNTNNSYGQISDETLKQDIVDAASQWNDIKNIRVRKFRFKDNPTGDLQIGVVAQELETVSAGLVSMNEGVKTVKYSVLYMKAVKCLQEAIAKIEALETEVAALKAS